MPKWHKVLDTLHHLPYTKHSSNKPMNDTIINFRDEAMRFIEEGHDPRHMLLCCLKYMSQDDVEDMLKINDYMTPPELDEEDDSWYTDPNSKASYHHY
jgi:hypothetical protein